MNRQGPGRKSRQDPGRILKQDPDKILAGSCKKFQDSLYDPKKSCRILKNPVGPFEDFNDSKCIPSILQDL